MEGDDMRMALRDVLAEIEDANGRLTPETVVKAARDPDHPLHSKFIWDDAAAAHANRLATARRLIASVQLKVRHHRVVLAAPAYVRDPRAPVGVQGYRSTVKIRDDAEDARLTLVAEMERISAILRRTRGLCVALGRSADLDALEAEVERFVSAVAETGASEAGPQPS